MSDPASFEHLRMAQVLLAVLACLGGLGDVGRGERYV